MNTTSVSPGSSGDSRLQMRPALRLAVGQLPSSEQALVQIAVRVLTPHLKVPCEVVTQPHADITIKPVGEDMLEVSTQHAQRTVERPVRLSPLSDALSELIEDALKHEQPPTAPRDTTVAANKSADASNATVTRSARDANPNATPLLDLLLLREQAGPLHLTLQNGLEMFIDQRYHTAWSGEAIEALTTTIGDGLIAEQKQLGVVEFLQRTGKGNALHTILVEQLCWMLPHTPSSGQLLARWHQGDDAKFHLETWPNLSSQADMLAWLPLLTAASRAPLAMRDALRIADRAGISAQRARDGVSLLLMFKHAVLRPIETSTESVFIAPTSTAENAATAAPSSGLLSRLRSRLRNLMN